MRVVRFAAAVLFMASTALAGPGGTLVVHVVDGAGNPVAGAAVLLLPASEGEEEPPAAFTPPAVVRPGDPGDRVPVWRRTKERADAAGVFRAEGLEDRDWGVLVALEGMEEAWLRARPGQEALVLRVPGLREIAGTCVDDETGEPVANIPVWIGEDYPRGMVTLQPSPTDPRGRFHARGLLPGPYRITIGGEPEPFGEREASDYDRDHLGKYLEGVAAGTTDLVVRLSRGLSIEGRLVDDLGKAAAGVTVEAVRQSATGGEYLGGGSGSVVSGPDGAFRIAPLPPGLFGLKVGRSSDHGRSLETFGDMRSRFPDDAKEKAPEPPGELLANRRYAGTTVDHVKAGTKGLEVRVVRDVRILGRLVDGKGGPHRPGEELPLYVIPADGPFVGSSHGFEGTVRADGTFETDPLDPGGTYDLAFFRGQGKGSGAARGVKAGQADVTITVTPGTSISGRVLDGDGKPVGPGVPVESVATGLAEGRPGGYVRTMTREGGTFDLDVADGMSVLLFTGGGGSAFLRTQGGGGEYLPGEAGVELRARRGAVLAGRLLDAPGAVYVAAGAGPTFPVAADGSFRIRGLEPGKVLLRAWVGDGERVLGTFEAPAEDVEIPLPR